MIHNFERCWSIFQAKDSTYDGVFYVGVMSTKIYCRPSCSARPQRKNVQFFADITSAESAGLRPCKRCTPDTIPTDIALCHNVCRYIESCHETPSLNTIARAVGYSPFHLHRTFRRTMGISPFGYVQAIRQMRVQQLLKNDITVQEAVAQAGYGSISAFYHAHRGKKLRHQKVDTYAIARCMHAHLIVIGIFSEHGLQYCGVFADEQTAQNAIAVHCGSAKYGYDAALSRTLLNAINDNQLDVGSRQLALDIRATTFQHRVWQAIRQIPVGRTASYATIAQSIGQPNAVRAVANACAQNPLALITPCHRVVTANTMPGKYRWGSALKAKLLSYETQQRYNVETPQDKE